MITHDDGDVTTLNLTDGRVVTDIADKTKTEGYTDTGVYTYDNGYVSAIEIKENGDFEYKESFKFKNGNMVLCRDQDTEGSETYVFEYGTTPNNVNIDLFAYIFDDSEGYVANILGLCGVRNKNLPSKSDAYTMTYEMKGDYVTKVTLKPRSEEDGEEVWEVVYEEEVAPQPEKGVKVVEYED